MSGGRRTGQPLAPGYQGWGNRGGDEVQGTEKTRARVEAVRDPSVERYADHCPRPDA